MVEICLNPDNDIIGMLQAYCDDGVMNPSVLAQVGRPSSQWKRQGTFIDSGLTGSITTFCDTSGERLDWAIRTAEKLLRVKTLILETTHSIPHRPHRLSLLAGSTPKVSQWATETGSAGQVCSLSYQVSGQPRESTGPVDRDD